MKNNDYKELKEFVEEMRLSVENIDVSHVSKADENGIARCDICGKSFIKKDVLHYYCSPLKKCKEFSLRSEAGVGRSFIDKDDYGKVSAFKNLISEKTKEYLDDKTEKRIYEKNGNE